MSLPAAAFAAQSSYDKVFGNRDATGGELANAFFDLLSQTGSPTGVVGTTPEQNESSKAIVKPYIDKAFLLQRATGERYTADTYIPADVDTFEIGDVHETRPSDFVVVVRYSVRASETLPDAALVMSGAKAPRLTVFHWDETDLRWKILSHANYSTPIAAICDQKPLIRVNPISSVSEEDQALGERLLAEYYDVLMKGTTEPILNPMVQAQSASGLGYTTLAERKIPSKYKELHFNDALVTRNKKVIVVASYNQAGQRSFLKAVELRGSLSPSITTFMQDEGGNWSVISAAGFAAAIALPDGAECVPEGKLEAAP